MVQDENALRLPPSLLPYRHVDFIPQTFHAGIPWPDDGRLSTRKLSATHSSEVNHVARLGVLLMGPVQQLLSEILVKLPAVLAALLLLLIGMVVGKIARAAVEKFLKFVRVDEYMEKVRVNELLARLGFGQSPVFVVGFLVYWLIILVFLVSAAARECQLHASWM